MTAKEKVLSVYPDAVCDYVFYPEIEVWAYEIIAGNKIVADLCVTENWAWESALNELIKNGLCTE